MSTYNIIAASNESTVVAEYTPESARSDSFQSEAALEKEFIRLLCEQGYEYLSVHDESGLITNLRRQLEVLNTIPLLTASGNASSRRSLPMLTMALLKRAAPFRPTM